MKAFNDFLDEGFGGGRVLCAADVPKWIDIDDV